jgi:hypothetical protein
MPGRQDWQGTPLTHGIDVLASGLTLMVGPGQTASFPVFTITRPGYLLNVSAVYTTGEGTSGLFTMDVAWYESTQSTRFGHEGWRMAVGGFASQAPWFHTGRGPTKGQLLVLSFTNRDTVQTIQVAFWLAQTTQHASRDDIRVHVNGSSPVWALDPGGDPVFNRLASISGQSIVAGHTDTYLLPLYSGQVALTWAATGQSAANVLNLSLVQADPLNTFAPDYTQSASATPFASPDAILVTLPRKVMSLVVHNGGTSTASYTVSMVAQEYSS